MVSKYWESCRHGPYCLPSMYSLTSNLQQLCRLGDGLYSVGPLHTSGWRSSPPPPPMKSCFMTCMTISVSLRGLKCPARCCIGGVICPFLLQLYVLFRWQIATNWITLGRQRGTLTLSCPQSSQENASYSILPRPAFSSAEIYGHFKQNKFNYYRSVF